MKHGTFRVYQYQKCRCPECLAWASEHNRKCRERMRARVERQDVAVKHGDAAYRAGCRCDVCCAAASAIAKRLRERMQSSTRATAVNHGNEWTTAEIEVVCALPAKEAALVLGRTHKACSAMKTRVSRKEPKIMRLLTGADAPTRNAVLPPTTLEY